MIRLLFGSILIFLVVLFCALVVCVPFAHSDVPQLQRRADGPPTKVPTCAETLRELRSGMIEVTAREAGLYRYLGDSNSESFYLNQMIELEGSKGFFPTANTCRIEYINLLKIKLAEWQYVYAVDRSLAASYQ